LSIAEKYLAGRSKRVAIDIASVGTPLFAAKGDLVTAAAYRRSIDLSHPVMSSGQAWYIGAIANAVFEYAMARGDHDSARDVLHYGLAALNSADESYELLVAIARYGPIEDIGRARMLLERRAIERNHPTARRFLLLFDGYVESRLGRERSARH